VVAHRAYRELTATGALNFGFGMSADVAYLIAESGEADKHWITVEQGLHNGTLMTGDLFGIASNPVAITPSASQFDFYSGGGLAQTFLGMAELDQHGNVNVSHIGGLMSGPGGFIDISQGAKNVVFCGSFAAKGLRVRAEGGKLAIDRQGQVHKLVRQVAGITFAGAEAVKRGQRVTYVTERAVFSLSAEGVVLEEIAPGVELQRDVLDQMDFVPVIRSPRIMDAALFG
jgi:acyl CoA:acetate/3-ketoacid CoA transferase